MMETPFSLKSIPGEWNRFFHSPSDPSFCGVLRILLGILLLINNLVLLPDLALFFGETGVMPLQVSRQIIDKDTLSLFMYLPQTDTVLWLCFALFNISILLLLLGVASRVQMAIVFVFLVSFHHRHLILFDNEDVMLRLVCFYAIFLPLDASYSLMNRRKPKPPLQSLWAMRLIQIQLSLSYLSTGLSKLDGSAWLDGTTLYYVSRLDELWGFFPMPGFPFDSLILIKLMTWSVIIVELFVSVGLWFQQTRRAAIFLAAFFHIACIYSMNLFLFHWLMLVCLMTFLTSEEREGLVSSLRKRLSTLKSRIHSPAR